MEEVSKNRICAVKTKGKAIYLYHYSDKAKPYKVYISYEVNGVWKKKKLAEYENYIDADRLIKDYVEDPEWKLIKERRD